LSEDPLDRLANRVLTIKPHKKSYQHREVICAFVTVTGKRTYCLAITEYGEQVENLANHLLVHPQSYVIVTNNVAWLADYMLGRYGHLECFQMKLTEARSLDDAGEVKANLSRIGFTNGRKAQHSGRRKAMHNVWSSDDFPETLFNSSYGWQELLTAAVDVRDYCKEQSLAVPNKPKGMAGDFMRDPKFWLHERGRVPEFINETLRPYLPGNHMELRGEVRKIQTVWSIDMRNAYHKLAQSITIPDHTHMYGRGYSRSWRDAPIWFTSGTPEFERELQRYGLVIVEATSRPTRQKEWRPRAINYSGKKRIALWTNEIEFCKSMGLDIHGIIAAWTSNHADTGLSKYGQFAESEASRVNLSRRKWLKPTFHTLYGMFAANKKSIRIGHLRGKSKSLFRFSLGFGHTLELPAFEIPQRSHPLSNVAILGTLQAEIRVRMMQLANELESKGHPVTHIHADGLHVATSNLPLLSDDWKIEEREDLVYIDDVSWIWATGETLPGRPELERQREIRRYNDMVTAGLYGYRRRFSSAA
jgi:hypothetical protein